MLRAQIDIALRNGSILAVGFPTTEEVNAFVERIKKAVRDYDGIFTFDMQDPATKGLMVHNIPSREIVRFSIRQLPRLNTPVPS